MQAGALERDEFVWLAGSLCHASRRPFDAALVLQRFPAPHSERQLLEALQSLGFRVGEAALAKAVFPCIGFLKGERERPALMFGAEGPGLTAAALDACDRTVVIPMHAGVDSLNVAAATAVACWELSQPTPR